VTPAATSNHVHAARHSATDHEQVATAVLSAGPADDPLSQHHEAIRPKGAVLVIAGGVESAAAVDAAGRAFSGWDGAASDGRAVREVALAGAVRRLEVVPDKTQSDIIIGWPGLPRNDPRFVAARVTNMVFAADTFASRAGHVVRDELGLT